MKRHAITLSDYLKLSEGNKDRDKGKSERGVVKVNSNVRCPVSEQCETSSVKPSDKEEWKLVESESCKKENSKSQKDHPPSLTYASMVKKSKSEKVKCDQPEVNYASEVTSNKRLNYASPVDGKYINSE